MKQMKLSMAWGETFSPARFIPAIVKRRPILCRGIHPWLSNLLLTWQRREQWPPTSPPAVPQSCSLREESEEGKRSPSCPISKFGKRFLNERGISGLDPAGPHFVESKSTCVFLVHLQWLLSHLWTTVLGRKKWDACPGSIKALLLLADQGASAFR